MKYGYSNLLGETIDARELVYDDIKAFQIVCPVCREPVFKAVRELFPAPWHYLSHYRAAKAYAADCELRVAGYSPAEVDRNNIISRGQKLALYLRVLQSAIVENSTPTEPARWHTAVRQVLHSKALGKVREVMRGGCARMSPQEFSQCADHYVNEDVGTGHAMWRSGFAIAVQKRIAWDIWATLSTTAARSNFDFLWASAYLFLARRLELTVAERNSAPDRTLWAYMQKLVASSRTGGTALLAEMQNRPTPSGWAIDRSNYLHKMVAEISHEMIGTLLRLPYPAIVAQASTHRQHEVTDQ